MEVIRRTAGSDERITLIDEGAKNQGAAHARNRGVETAKGRYICYIDADDLWSPDKLDQTYTSIGGAWWNNSDAAATFDEESSWVQRLSPTASTSTGAASCSLCDRSVR